MDSYSLFLLMYLYKTHRPLTGKSHYDRGIENYIMIQNMIVEVIIIGYWSVSSQLIGNFRHICKRRKLLLVTDEVI